VSRRTEHTAVWRFDVAGLCTVLSMKQICVKGFPVIGRFKTSHLWAIFRASKPATPFGLLQYSDQYSTMYFRVRLSTLLSLAGSVRVCFGFLLARLLDWPSL
jgi:hypothetical protein